jgi:hypothetical protein
VKNFEVILGTGGSNVGGWTIHRHGDKRCLDPREVSALPEPLEVDYRRNGKLIEQGILDPRSRWWRTMDEELVYYGGNLLPLSVARTRVQISISESQYIADETLPSSLSRKEIYFRTLGQNTLSLSGGWPEFEEAKTMSDFGGIYQSWQRAVYKFNPGVPKNLQTRSSEREELELLSMELEHEKDPAQVYVRYLPLMERYAHDRNFSCWLLKILAYRKKPAVIRPLSLKYYLLRGWIYNFLWGYDNQDRIQILIHVFGLSQKMAGGKLLEPQILKPAASRLGLKGSSNFRDAYPVAPFKFERWQDHRYKE